VLHQQLGLKAQRYKPGGANRYWGVDIFRVKDFFYISGLDFHLDVSV
jgi:hypothetical protein